ncbi:hypothetical protein [Siphonobacter aquaeclarae]|jgi:uncharacterized protein (UPF0333 family)|uniref:Lipocalin-like domain-containing protein n=1 Tax=Siphonobacter aquaeclarae TaxID=563176 RepID=A0A1G9X026_9BACT|nr:hypothetical protein [Siphonobacter aquaeclarae]SDM90092.1 hypothetical protein SAMN04488090_4505 [Siphonobacter aquaeclarae]
MKKRFLYHGFLVLLVLVSGCGKSKTKPVSEIIRKVWSVNIAKENGTTVYTKGSSSNIKSYYSKFILDLSNSAQQTVRLTTVDGTQFVGNWTLTNDNKLTLSNLTPVPSGTTGTIEYNITSTPTETQLNLTKVTPDPKTGNTTNDYQLVSP